MGGARTGARTMFATILYQDTITNRVRETKNNLTHDNRDREDPLSSEIVKIRLDDKECMVMGRHVIDGPDRSRLLIDVPTGILIDYRSKDITPAIGSVNSSSPVKSLGDREWPWPTPGARSLEIAERRKTELTNERQR